MTIHTDCSTVGDKVILHLLRSGVVEGSRIDKTHNDPSREPRRKHEFLANPEKVMFELSESTTEI